MVRALLAHALLLALLLLAACMVGPSTRVASRAAPAVTVTDSALPAKARTLLDSLNRLQSAPPPPTLNRGAWLDVFRDSQLVVLVNEAVANNRGLQYARAVIRQYRAGVTVARSYLFPQVSAVALRSSQKISFGTTSFQFKATNIEGEVSWPIDIWGGLRRQTEAARFDLRQSEEDLRDTTLSVVSSVATQYLQLLQLDEVVAVSETTLVDWGKTLDLTRRRFARGVISELDVRQFEAQLAQPVANIAEYSRQRTSTENQIAQLLGRGPARVPRGRPLSQVIRCVTVPDSIPSALIARRPDVRAAQRAVQASLAQVGVAVANELPSLKLTGDYGTQRPAFNGLFARSGEIYTLQLAFTVPLLTWGQLRGQVQAARAQVDQSRAIYEQVVLLALGEASTALAGVRSYRDQMVAQTMQTQALGRAVELAQRRYLSGVSSALDLLATQRALYTAQLALVQSQAQYLAATVELYQAVGGDWTVPVR